MFRRSYYSKFSFYHRLLQIILSPNRNEIFLVFRIGYFCSSFCFRKQEYNHVFNDDASLDEDKSDVSKKQRISIPSHSPAGDDLNEGGNLTGRASLNISSREIYPARITPDPSLI